MLLILNYNKERYVNFKLEDLLSKGVPQAVINAHISEQEWSEIRNKRNQLMDATDWTQMPDVQLTAEKKEDYRFYRQNLRDLPQHETNPDNVFWPSPPKI